MPAAANRQQSTHPTPRGAGDNSSKQVEKSRGEGVGRDEKDASYLYRSPWDATHLSPSNRKPGWASSQLIDIERKMREIKKIAPVAPKERKKQRSERGLTPQALSEGGNKQLIAKNHLEKTINEPWIRHEKQYTR